VGAFTSNGRDCQCNTGGSWTCKSAPQTQSPSRTTVVQSAPVKPSAIGDEFDFPVDDQLDAAVEDASFDYLEDDQFVFDAAVEDAAFDSEGALDESAFEGEVAFDAAVEDATFDSEVAFDESAFEGEVAFDAAVEDVTPTEVGSVPTSTQTSPSSQSIPGWGIACIAVGAAVLTLLIIVIVQLVVLVRS